MYYICQPQDGRYLEMEDISPRFRIQQTTWRDLGEISVKIILHGMYGFSFLKLKTLQLSDLEA